MAPSGTVTDYWDGTLSDDDRETFLRGLLVTPEMSTPEAQRIREEWPDWKILEVLETLGG